MFNRWGRALLLMVVVLVAMMMVVQPAMAQGTDAPKLPSYDTILWVGLLLLVFLSLAVAFLFGKHQGLDDRLKEVRSDIPTLNKIEAGAMSTFGPENMAQLRSGGNGLLALLMAFTPDDWDATIERSRDILNVLTDGQENLPPS